MPTLRQLSYLIALHEHGHFGRAATACFVTQSTLSSAIADLEKLLGVVLVERTKRSMRFTILGEKFVERARVIVRGVEDLCDTAQASSQPLNSSLRLAVIPTIAPFILPLIFPAVGAAWPELRLFVREMLTADACENLQRGTIDCVLLALPAECGDVEICEIGTDHLLLGMSQDDRVDAGPIALEDIDVSRLLLLEDGNCLKDHALQACGHPAAQSEARLVASTLHTLVQMVDAGLGITFLPEMAVSAGLLTGTKVKSYAVAGSSAERRIALVWRKGSALVRDFQLLGSTIRDSILHPNI